MRDSPLDERAVSGVTALTGILIIFDDPKIWPFLLVVTVMAAFAAFARIMWADDLSHMSTGHMIRLGFGRVMVSILAAWLATLSAWSWIGVSNRPLLFAVALAVAFLGGDIIERLAWTIVKRGGPKGGVEP